MAETNDRKKNNGKTPEIESENVCPICMEVMTNSCLTDSCGHEFCWECLSQWVQNHNYCPVCRQAFYRIGRSSGPYGQWVWTPVNNRQTTVRRLLFDQMDSMRRQLQRMRDNRSQEIEELQRRIQRRQQTRDRINIEISRLESIENENNEDIDRTLNEIRNTVNEINYENFSQTMSPLRWNQFFPQRHANNELMDGLDVEAKSTDSTDTLIDGVPRHPMAIEPILQLFANTPLNGFEPQIPDSDSQQNNIQYNIFGPNSMQTLEISSNNDGSVRSYQTTSYHFLSTSTPQGIQPNPEDNEPENDTESDEDNRNRSHGQAVRGRPNRPYNRRHF